MIDLRALRTHLITPHIKRGGIAVDCTMGNGNDTLYLSQAVGEDGYVYSFDIQDKALENTKALLENNNCHNNYMLIKDSHSNLKSYITEPICVSIFNLGYLPGGDKSLTTMRETTLPAVDAAVEMMAEDGIVFISVYPGHGEGKLEGEMIEVRYADIDRRIYCVSSFKIINSPTSPYFIIIEKRSEGIN